ncbi:MAG: hypothetical protein NVSMB57_14520 [Actinomycetota bacterium]
MHGPAGIMALVLAEMAVGGAAVLWLTPVRPYVRLGFYKLVGSVLTVCAILAWLSARAPLATASGGGGRRVAFIVLGVTAGLCVVWQLLLWTVPKLSWPFGYAVVPAGIAAFVALSRLPGASHGVVIGVLQLLGGSFFIGSVLIGLLLGHWYLVDRKLPGKPLGRIGYFLLGGSAAAAAVTIIGGGGGSQASRSLSPLLGAGALVVVIAVGLTALCTMIGFFVRKLVRENSMQSATGFFYLAVLSAISAEFAAKIRFY